MSEQSTSFCQYLPRNKGKRRRAHKTSEKSTPVSNFLITPSPGQVPSRSNKSKKYNTGTSEVKQKINTDDYNLFYIDAKIKERLKSKISGIDDLQKELIRTLWILTNGTDPVDRVLAKNRASQLRNSIRDLEGSFELLLYSFRTEDILTEYRSILSSKTRNFINIKPVDRTIDIRRDELISRYLCIAKEYIQIENLRYTPEKLRCIACQRSDFRLDDENSIYICTFCQTEVTMLDNTPSFKDTDRVNMSSRYTYTKRGHFIDAMKKFQGTQNIDPSKIEKVVNVLTREIERHNLEPRSDDPKKQVTKDHLYMFLQENKLSAHYENINLLHHIITGQSCPNIRRYEDDLLDDFEKQEDAYEQIQDEDRTNSLNVNYKLFKLLQRRGYSCRKDDFYILKTEAKQSEHDESLSKAWKLLGWKWIH